MLTPSPPPRVAGKSPKCWTFQLFRRSWGGGVSKSINRNLSGVSIDKDYWSPRAIIAIRSHVNPWSGRIVIFVIVDFWGILLLSLGRFKELLFYNCGDLRDCTFMLVKIWGSVLILLGRFDVISFDRLFIAMWNHDVEPREGALDQ